MSNVEFGWTIVRLSFWFIFAVYCVMEIAEALEWWKGLAYLICAVVFTFLWGIEFHSIIEWVKK